MDESLRGRLIVASPGLGDPNFRHTVVLILEHLEEGALGLVINRPSEVTLAETLPDWEGHAASPAVVFVGGPVATESLIGLGRFAAGGSPRELLLGDIGVVDLAAAPETGKVQAARVFAGHAGWAPGQLEGELEEGGWFVLDADPQDILHDDPESLWRDVLARQGGMFRTIPYDPGLN